MVGEFFLEQKERVRGVFAEVYFLLMRYERYGIGGCTDCGDGELLGAQLETLLWREQRDLDEAIDAIDSES